ncbi:MAG: hypothetical protein R2810_04770 [Flavobacteriales bacterium]
MPDPGRYAEVFADRFVVDRPKDVVSGDFHWFHRTGPDTCFVAWQRTAPDTVCPAP